MRPALPAAFLRAPIAHRALHDTALGRPENSLSAVRAAVAAGYGIEIDLQLSADGHAMVFHDETLGRLTPEDGPVNARTAADLGRIPLKNAQEFIPTLAQVLDAVAGQVPLLIELKDQSQGRGTSDGRLERATAEALSAYDGPVAVMSFNPACVAEMARLAPALPRGLTTCAYDPADWAALSPAARDRLRAIPDYDPVGASFISHEWADLARPRVAELKARGAAVLCWTIRNRGDEAEARRIAQNVTFEGYAATIPA
ncbi:MAG TPA: glycerophosphodiester phosphodiesterase family protein [Paracoccaceae bacterium]|nr:glycerophosphodiester phosphodiesterase family protein [Paracoccaceae bacterium]HMO72292.1 glycerophosphodiester phosphodiesterase family protein [Paracoccaceae bacterium]